MLGPFRGDFFSEIQPTAVNLSRMGDRVYVFKVETDDPDYPMLSEYPTYYFAHAEVSPRQALEEDPYQTVTVMGCAMDGEWLNQLQVHARKAGIAAIAESLGGQQIQSNTGHINDDGQWISR